MENFHSQGLYVFGLTQCLLTKKFYTQGYCEEKNEWRSFNIKAANKRLAINLKGKSEKFGVCRGFKKL